MPQYFKETALKEWGSDDMTHLEFAIHVEERTPTITVIVKDSREKTKCTHVLVVESEPEKEALIEGFRFFADILKESISLNERR